MYVLASSAGNLLAGFLPFPLLFSYPGYFFISNSYISTFKPTFSPISFKFHSLKGITVLLVI